MIFIGIDPGISGALVAMDRNAHIVLAEEMPTMPSPIPKRRMVDGRKLSALLRGTSQYEGSAPLVALERVGAMPRQSPVSMFSFGQSYGTVIGVLGSLAYSWDFVAPQEWKKFHRLGPDKAQSVGLAMRRWPGLNLKKSDDGIAEAALIADWLRIRNNL